MFKMGSIVFFSIALLFLAVSPMCALQIQPLRTFAKVEAGQETTGAIRLINEKEVSVQIEISFEDIARTQGKIDTEWLFLNRDTFTIEPKQQALFEYKVALPSEASGEYCARIGFLEKPEQTGSAQMLTINSKISVPFFAIVQGTEIYDCEVVSFKMDNQAMNEARVVLRNRGNVHIRPPGKCVIKSLSGNTTVQSNEINSRGYPLYPGEEHGFKVQFEEALAPGQYVAELQFAMFARNPYTAHESIEFEIAEIP